MNDIQKISFLRGEQLGKLVKLFKALVGSKAEVVDIKDYAGSARNALPTLSAVFLYGGHICHQRTIYNYDTENGYGQEFYHVFCVEHDGEYENDYVGHLYVVFNNKLQFVSEYDSGNGDNVPDFIRRGFGEAVATEEMGGMMSAEDKHRLNILWQERAK